MNITCRSLPAAICLKLMKERLSALPIKSIPSSVFSASACRRPVRLILTPCAARPWVSSILFCAKNYPLTLDFLIDESIALFKGILKKPADEIKKDVLDFFRGRLQNQLISQGYAYDTVEAVLADGITDVVMALEKIKACRPSGKIPNLNRFPSPLNGWIIS